LKSLSQRITSLIAEAKNLGLLRHIPQVEKRDAETVKIAGRTLFNFASNDYLGLSHHPAVLETVAKAAKELPTSSSSSRLICGDSEQLRQLETDIAELKQRESSLVFPSGYHTNIGTICALCRKGDFILSDNDNHASLIDAIRLSGATVLIFKHNDPESLEANLKKVPDEAFCLVVTESVFSTDGSVAPLPKIIEICERYGATLMLDEAHATGTLGETGRGTEEQFNLKGRCHILMGTLGKALASLGGFIAGSPELTSALTNRARSLIYSTALPPLSAVAASAAIRTLLKDPAPLEKLRKNIQLFVNEMKKRTDLDFSRKVQTPIFPIRIGDEREVIVARAKLIEKGFYTAALRYPTVPKGAAMLRISLSAVHSEESVTSLAAHISEIISEKNRLS